MAGTCSTAESVMMYKNGHSVLLLKAMKEGETIIHSKSGAELSTILHPIKNLYSNHLQILAHIKLRIAHSTFQTLPFESIVDDHHLVGQLLTQAQILCSQGVAMEPQLLAEIQLELVKVQRLLCSFGCGDAKEALKILVETRKLCESRMKDLRIIRQTHLEAALIELTNIQAKFGNNSKIPIDLDRVSSSPSVSTGITPTMIMSRSFSLDVGVISQPLEVTQGKIRVATALFSAFHAIKGIRQRSLMPGEITGQTFSNEDKSSLPDFLILDLASDHVNLPDVSPAAEDATTELLSLIRGAASGFSWIRIFTYFVTLQRKSRLSSLLVGGSSYNDEIGSSDSSGAVSSQNRADTTVQTPLGSSNIPLRLSALQNYLSTRLTMYSSYGFIPPVPKEQSFAAVQWYRNSAVKSFTLLWCVARADTSVDCSATEVSSTDHSNILQQITDLKKRTDEFFGRSLTQSDLIQKKKSKQKASVSLPIDQQLSDDWKHVLNQVVDLISAQDEILTELPFEINMETAESVMDLFTIGCCVKPPHPLYKWLVSLLCPC
uniref:Uncharacterized protein n=4 Tax=Ciona intestinalis TaxID=7719 RepID=F6QSS7_CIOIN